MAIKYLMLILVNVKPDPLDDSNIRANIVEFVPFELAGITPHDVDVVFLVYPIHLTSLFRSESPHAVFEGCA